MWRFALTTLKRPPLPGDGQTDGDLEEIVPFVLEFPESEELRVAGILHLETGIGGIEEDQVDAQVM